MIAAFLLLLTLGGIPDAGPEQSMLLEDSYSVDLLDQARTEILSGRLGRAESTLYRLAAQDDGAAAAYYHLATGSVLKVLLFDRDVDYERFFDRSDSLRKILSSQPRSAGRRFLTGEADFQRSLAWAKKGSYVRAAMASVSAYRTLTQLVEDDPSYLEAYKSLGIVHAMLGTLPSRYRRVLSIFGFETDVHVGLDQLELAAEQARYGRAESLVFMSILDSFNFPSRVRADSVLQELYEEYDQSPLIAMVLSDALLRNREVARAEEVLETVLGRSDPDLISIDYLDAFLADVRFKQERWDEAAIGYAAFRDGYQGSALKSVSALRQGIALEMSGKRNEAEAAYRAVVADRDFDSDAASARSARLRMANPMNAVSRTLLRARCAFDRSDFERADSLLTSLPASDLPLGGDGGNAGIEAEISYRRGRLLDETGSDLEAIVQYQRAIDRTLDPAAKWAPYSLYYLAKIEEEAGQLEQARSTYQRVVDYRPDYDYRGTNEQLALFALERLRN